MKVFKKLNNLRKMRFSTRILISFIAISIIPIIIILAAYNITTSYSLNQYGIDGLKSEGIYNNAFLISKLTNEEIKALAKTAKEESAKLENISYLKELNEDLEEKDSFIVIRKKTGYCLMGLTIMKTVRWKIYFRITERKFPVMKTG